MATEVKVEEEEGVVDDVPFDFPKNDEDDVAWYRLIIEELLSLKTNVSYAGTIVEKHAT